MEKGSNRTFVDMVKEAYASKVPWEEITSDYPMTRRQARHAVKSIKKTNPDALTYVLTYAKSDRQRKHLSEVKKGKLPVEAMKARMTVWPKVGPLLDRGFDRNEIQDLTGFSRVQIKHAVNAKERKIQPSVRYSASTDVVLYPSIQFIIKPKDPNYSQDNSGDQYEQNIKELAKGIVGRGLISDISDWDILTARLEHKKLSVRSKAQLIVLEAVLRAKRLSASGERRSILFYRRVAKAAEEVLYREEDYAVLNSVKRFAA